MALPFRTPLTKEEQQVLLSLPRTRSGNVTNPLYLPPEQRPDYERALGQWCRENPRRSWPQWLSDYVDRRRHEAGKAARVADRDDAAAVPGLAEGEA